MEYDFKKALAFGLCILGLLIFYGVLTTKLDVMADQARANVEKISSDAQWESLLYKKAIHEVVQSRQSEAGRGDPSTEGLK